MNKQNAFLQLQRLDNELFMLLCHGNIVSGKFRYSSTKEKVDEYCVLLNKFMEEFDDMQMLQSGLHYYNRKFLRNRLEYAKVECQKAKVNPKSKPHQNNNPKSNQHSNNKNYSLESTKKIAKETIHNLIYDALLDVDESSSLYEKLAKYEQELKNRVNNATSSNEVYDIVENAEDKIEDLLDNYESPSELQEEKDEAISEIKETIQDILDDTPAIKRAFIKIRLQSIVNESIARINKATSCDEVDSIAENTEDLLDDYY